MAHGSRSSLVTLGAPERPHPDLDVVLDNLPDPVLVVGADGHLRWANRRAEQAFGRHLDDGAGRPITELIHPDDAETVAQVLASVPDPGVSTAVEGRIAHPDGRWRRYEVRAWSGVHDPRVGGVVLVLRAVEDPARGNLAAADLTRLGAVLDRGARTMLADLAHRATHDALTGLANRHLLLERLDLALRSRSAPGVVGLVFCDVDGFKDVNDTWGHRVGDEVLVAAAERMRAVLDPDDLAGRLGGDELVAVATRPSERALHDLAARLGAALTAPLETSVGPVEVSTSVGLACTTGSGRADELLHGADQAMYARKRARRRA